MLHIITPLYRFENFETVYNSILMNEDITWHVGKSNKREDINSDIPNKDKRVKIYNVDCYDQEGFRKRNAALSEIKQGYFCFLDDDTVFHENMYMKYLECKENNFIGMIVGEQLNPRLETRLIASPPKLKFIDTGNVLSYTSCLKECRWPEKHIEGQEQKDYLFWKSVFEFYGNKCGIWNTPISYYNMLSTNEEWKKEKKVKFLKK